MNNTTQEEIVITDRCIGRFDGVERGPLLIAIGGMHGNEPAGVLGIQRLLEMLSFEHAKNPDFTYRGRFVGLVGNLKALRQKKRFLQRDLNRNLDPEILSQLDSDDELKYEDAEAYQLFQQVKLEIANYQPNHLVLIDLHTTTADGGVFSIVNDSPAARAIALDLRAPVILGMLNGISNTSLHCFTTETLGVSTVSLVFESGQHDDPLSVDRAVSALVKTMRSTGAVHPRDVEGRHDKILKQSTDGLPDLVEFVYAHAINSDDEFVMRPGYMNFGAVLEGEHIADDAKGPIKAKTTGLILMPLYQKQGEDGFFIVKEI